MKGSAGVDDGEDGVGVGERRDGPGDGGGERAGRGGVADRVAQLVTRREACRERTAEGVAGTGGVDRRDLDGRFAPGLDDTIDRLGDDDPGGARAWSRRRTRPVQQRRHAADQLGFVFVGDHDVAQLHQFVRQ